mmetsp:Transcript_21604/g.60305  ORF Transcript_21604/g.60305 Transcript_21604/m.60305 type:complete len:205 (-) Transcript_21604:77-691(-)
MAALTRTALSPVLSAFFLAAAMHIAAADFVTRGVATSEVERLKEDVRHAMLALYMQNARARVGAIASSPPTPQSAFGKLQSFGREDTAAELTDTSIADSNAMVDQIERAVVAETKRSMYRALTHLRGATVSSFDGMANAQAANIDRHARSHEWTSENKLEHLADREADTGKWAFPPTLSTPPPTADFDVSSSAGDAKGAGAGAL